MFLCGTLPKAISFKAPAGLHRARWLSKSICWRFGVQKTVQDGIKRRVRNYVHLRIYSFVAKLGFVHLQHHLLPALIWSSSMKYKWSIKLETRWWQRFQWRNFMDICGVCQKNSGDKLMVSALQRQGASIEKNNYWPNTSRFQETIWLCNREHL